MWTRMCIWCIKIYDKRGLFTCLCTICQGKNIASFYQGFQQSLLVGDQPLWFSRFWPYTQVEVPFYTRFPDMINLNCQSLDGCTCYQLQFVCRMYIYIFIMHTRIEYEINIMLCIDFKNFTKLASAHEWWIVETESQDIPCQVKGRKQKVNFHV